MPIDKKYPIGSGGGGGSSAFADLTGSPSDNAALDAALDAKQDTGNYVTALTGEVTASGPGSVAATLSNSAVIGKALTGFTSGAGTVAATDTILQAIQKLDGNVAAKAPLDSPTFTTRTRHTYATATRMVYFDANKDLTAVTAVTSTRLMFADSNGLPTFTGLGVYTGYGANDPAIYTNNSLTFRVQGSAGIDAAFFDSAGSFVMARTNQAIKPDNATTIDVGITGRRFRNFWQSGAHKMGRGSSSGSATISDNVSIHAVTGTAGATLTLPSAATVESGHILYIKDEGGNAGTNNITINRAGSDTIDGVTSQTISTNYGSIQLYSNGTNWFKL